MKLIEGNKTVIDFLVKDFTLLDSKLLAIEFRKNALKNVEVNLEFELLYSKQERGLKLTFEEVEEFSFQYESNYAFYNVEILKFFMIDEVVYLSLDPFNEIEEISPKDQDFIKAKIVKAFLS